MLAVILSVAFSAAVSAEDKVEPKGKSAEKIKKLLTQRRDLLKKTLDLHFRAIQGGGALRADRLTKLSKELLQAELDLAATPKERLAAHEARLELAKRIEKTVRKAHEAGGATTIDLNLAEADRIEAEVGWLRAGGEEKKEKKDK
jgi:hypothetical protein